MPRNRQISIDAIRGHGRHGAGSARGLVLLFSMVCLAAGLASASHANAASSPSYGLEQSVVGSVGGDSSAAGTQSTDTGGEAFVGPASSATYSIGAGYIPQLDNALTLGVDAPSVSMTPWPGGASEVAQTAVNVLTDAPGYTLLASQDQNLLHTDAVTTFGSVAGTIAVPAAWTEGTTTGLGFTILSGTGVDGKWGTTPNFNFAAFPASATAIHAKTGYQSTNDQTVVRYRLGAVSSQKPGAYSNTVTYTAVVLV